MELKSGDAIIDRRVVRIAARYTSTLIRLYEFLKSDSRMIGHEIARRAISSQMMVEVNGIEPMTPCLQSRCSPS